MYFRREIPFVDYVRDREVADVHLLVTQQRTGSGGREYTLNFIGRGRFLGVDQRLSFSAPQGQTRDEERSALAHRTKLGLIPYVSNTAMAPHFTVLYSAPEVPEQVADEQDPWDNWVFEVQGDGRLDGEASRRSIFLSGNVSASRVTEMWKVGARLYADYRSRRFERDDAETIRSTRESRRATASAVYSLAGHWSIGSYVRAHMNSYQNVDLGLRIAPALEYSVYPYDVSARKELTLAYRVGVQTLNYIETTIFGKLEETLANESLTVTLRATQPWGNTFVRLEGSHYLHDFSKNRVEFYSNISVRVFRGLSVRMFGGLDIIHDQLYLPAGEGSLEDLLLQQKQLATTYEYGGGLGLSYTFGSIYSNVVNTRL